MVYSFSDDDFLMGSSAEKYAEAACSGNKADATVIAQANRFAEFITYAKINSENDVASSNQFYIRVY